MISARPFRLGTAFGVPLWVHPVPLTASLFLAVPCAIRDPLLAVTLSIVLIASILAHEVGHALAAKWIGLRVEAIHHFGCIGFCVFEDPGRRTMHRCVVAVAGPVVNLLIALLLLPIALVFSKGWVSTTVGSIFLMNLALGIGNLLPIYPLDGGQILFASLWARWPERIAVLVTTGVGTVVAVPAALVALLFVVIGLPTAILPLWALNWSIFKRVWRGQGGGGDYRNARWPSDPIPPADLADRMLGDVLAEQRRRNAKRRHAKRHVLSP